MSQEDTTLFTAVDRTGDPGFFTRFLDEGNRLPDMQACKPFILEGLRLREEATVLDAGCGTGEEVAVLAAAVGRAGKAVGVDVSETMIAEARRRAEGSGLSLEFHVADARALPFPDGMFDACRSERMLMHVPEPERAMAEMARVTKRGGRLCVFDLDWDTLVIDSPERETTRAVVRSFSDAITNGWIGRRLAGMVRELGVVDVDVIPRVLTFPYEFLELFLGGHLVRAQQAGVVKPDEVQTWWEGLSRAAADGTFLAGVTAFVVSGTKP